jgi:cell division septal protein FtsQ
MIASILLLLSCLAFLAAVLAGQFRVRHVDVIGAGAASDEVVQASDVVGENIFTVRSDRLISRLDAVPGIDVSRVDTSLPNRVTIYVRVRPAVIAWKRNGQLVEVDRLGEVLGQVKSSSLPLVTGSSLSGTLDAGTVMAVRYASQLLPAQPDGALSTMRYDPKVGLTLVARLGWTALIGKGSPQALVSRVATLASFLHSLHERGRLLTLVDLRNRPAYARFSGP